jgi:hypothetical protein
MITLSRGVLVFVLLFCIVILLWCMAPLLLCRMV